MPTGKFVGAFMLAMLFLVGTAIGVQWVTKRAAYAEVTATYLFGSAGVLNAEGHPVSRQQIIDAALHQWIEQNPGLGLQFKETTPK